MTEKKILVLDDEPTNAKMLALMLKVQGRDSEVFFDSMTALSVIEACPESYSLILADRVMPRLEAPELIRRLAGNTATRGIPVVVVTGLAETFEKIELIQAGAFDILIKPIEMELLKVVVERALAL